MLSIKFTVWNCIQIVTGHIMHQRGSIAQRLKWHIIVLLIQCSNNEAFNSTYVGKLARLKGFYSSEFEMTMQRSHRTQTSRVD